MTERSNRLVWIDLETTGFDPFTNVILEIAVVITEQDLRLLRSRTKSGFRNAASIRCCQMCKTCTKDLVLLQRAKLQIRASRTLTLLVRSWLSWSSM